MTRTLNGIWAYIYPRVKKMLVTDHGALSGLTDDDHTQYQLRSEKSAANGYTSLDGTTRVPTVELATGVASSSTFLRGDRTWAAPPGGAGASWTYVMQNLGSTPVSRGRFTLVDAGISPTSKVLIYQAVGPYTGKGTRADESEMDQIVALAEAGSGEAIVRWRVLGSIQMAEHRKQGATNAIGGVGRPELQATTGLAPAAMAARQTKPIWIGRVKGNVQFVYTVA